MAQITQKMVVRAAKAHGLKSAKGIPEDLMGQIGGFISKVEGQIQLGKSAPKDTLATAVRHRAVLTQAIGSGAELAS